MGYIVIETFGGAEPAINLTDEDGSKLVFDNSKGAGAEAADGQGYSQLQSEEVID